MIALALAACGSAPAPIANTTAPAAAAAPPGDLYDEQQDLMARYVAQTCACATRACAARVETAYRARFDDFTRRFTGLPTDAQIARHKQLARQYYACFDRLQP